MNDTPSTSQIPIPSHFDADQVGQVWRIPYQERLHQARAWHKHTIFLPHRKIPPDLFAPCRCPKYILHSGL